VGGDIGFLVLIWGIYLVVEVGLQTCEGHVWNKRGEKPTWRGWWVPQWIFIYILSPLSATWTISVYWLTKRS